MGSGGLPVSFSIFATCPELSKNGRRINGEAWRAPSFHRADTNVLDSSWGSLEQNDHGSNGELSAIVDFPAQHLIPRRPYKQLKALFPRRGGRVSLGKGVPK